MEVNVRDVKRDEHLEFDVTMQLPRIASSVVDVEKLGDVHVVGTATWSDPYIHVTGEISSTVDYTCSRCLTPFAKKLHTSFAVDYTTSEAKADDEVHLVVGDSIDLTADFEEAVFLAVDDRPICRKDCKGLCPNCGTNLNLSACDCDTTPVDPRLAALKDLLSEGFSE